MPVAAHPQMSVCLALTRAISRTRTVDDIYLAALDALSDGLGVSRASILLLDADGVMRFKAHRGLSDAYRAAVEGHSPWTADTSDPQPIAVADVTAEPTLAPFLPVIQAEGIAAMGFVPLVSLGRVIGKLMIYYDAPHALGEDELQLAGVVAALVAFAIERKRAEDLARRNEERLRFALDAASMGTWDWDIATGSVRWSDNLERIHGLPAGTFDGTFASYEREIHGDDRERVLASARRAIEQGVPHDVEYRIVAPDGTVRWVEGKGHVEFDDGRPVRMTGVCMIVTRRKEAELARLAAAEEASRLKDEFLATLSHELRTPLNAILGWVQILRTGAPAAEQVGRALEIIGRNAALQAQLIEDILDVSRIITGKLEIERLPVLVPHLLEMAVNAAVPAARAKGIRLTSDVQPDLPPIEGDARRLQQVVGNVLSNAIKFTPEGGEVAVRCRAEQSTIAIEVSDSGTGIDPPFLPYVFDRFRQGDSRSTRRHGGLGLGLAIARHIAVEHGGGIEARSAGRDRGSAFTIRIPVRTMPAPAVIVSPHAAGTGAMVRLDGLTALVVDDHKDARELLAALFDRCGARVVECDGAAAALAALDGQPIDLLVADIGMPDIDGYELIERVRRTRPDLHAVALSAYARPEDQTRALAAGYDAYCAKPFDAARLIGLVNDLRRRDRVRRTAAISGSI